MILHFYIIFLIIFCCSIPFNLSCLINIVKIKRKSSLDRIKLQLYTINLIVTFYVIPFSVARESNFFANYTSICQCLFFLNDLILIVYHNILNYMVFDRYLFICTNFSSYKKLEIIFHIISAIVLVPTLARVFDYTCCQVGFKNSKTDIEICHSLSHNNVTQFQVNSRTNFIGIDIKTSDRIVLFYNYFGLFLFAIGSLVMVFFFIQIIITVHKDTRRFDKLNYQKNKIKKNKPFHRSLSVSSKLVQTQNLSAISKSVKNINEKRRSNESDSAENNSNNSNKPKRYKFKHFLNSKQWRVTRSILIVSFEL
jgi:hypothetical protein